MKTIRFSSLRSIAAIALVLLAPGNIALAQAQDSDPRQKLKGLLNAHLIAAYNMAAEGKFESAKRSFERQLIIDTTAALAKTGLEFAADAVNRKIKRQTAIHLSNAFMKSLTDQTLNLSIAELDKAIRLNPEYHVAYRIRADFYHAKSSYDQALSDYSRAISLCPISDAAHIYLMRAGVYLEKGAHDLNQPDISVLNLALHDLNQAIDLAPNLRPAYHVRGLLLMGLKHYGDAFKDYSHLLTSDRTDAKAWYGAARALDHLGQRDHAIECYRIFIEICPPAQAQQLEEAKKRIAALESDRGNTFSRANGSSSTAISGGTYSDAWDLHIHNTQFYLSTSAGTGSAKLFKLGTGLGVRAGLLFALRENYAPAEGLSFGISFTCHSGKPAEFGVGDKIRTLHLGGELGHAVNSGRLLVHPYVAGGLINFRTQYDFSDFGGSSYTDSFSFGYVAPGLQFGILLNGRFTMGPDIRYTIIPKTEEKFLSYFLSLGLRLH